MALKIGFHTPFYRHSTMKFGNSYPQNLGQAYCTSSNIIVMCLTGVMIDFQRTNAGWSESYFRENKKKTLSLPYCLGQTNGYMHILAMRNNQSFVWVYYHWIDDNNTLLTIAMVEAISTITPFEGMFGFSSHRLFVLKLKGKTGMVSIQPTW